MLENVVVKEDTRAVHYASAALTENTRASYPINFIDNARIPCVGPHPRNVVLLCWWAGGRGGRRGCSATLLAAGRWAGLGQAVIIHSWLLLPHFTGWQIFLCQLGWFAGGTIAMGFRLEGWGPATSCGGRRGTPSSVSTQLSRWQPPRR